MNVYSATRRDFLKHVTAWSAVGLPAGSAVRPRAVHSDGCGTIEPS